MCEDSAQACIDFGAGLLFLELCPLLLQLNEIALTLHFHQKKGDLDSVEPL